MEATETKLLEFLRKAPQLTIPIYQRTYSWTEAQCRQLWNDILRTGEDDKITSHFIGSIVYIGQGIFQVATPSPLLVIDGQQRLTTVFLVIEALARHLGESEPIQGFSARKLRSYYLQNTLEDGDLRYKLILTQNDKQTLMAIVNQKPLPEERSLRVSKNFDLLFEMIKQNDESVMSLCKGLSKLTMVDISLDRDHDNPQLIFESMNSTGLELSQADLIRNFVLMDLDQEHQTRLYNEHWRPMEIAFGQEAYGKHFDWFMRHYLTCVTGEIPNVRKVYDAFKKYARQPDIARRGIDALVADIHTYTGHYCAMALGQETSAHLDTAFRDLRELKVDVAYPLLLELYHDYSQGILDSDELGRVVRLIESYVFRRAVCAIPTNSLNRTFASFANALKKDRYLESIQAHFMLLPSYRRFPSDDEFQREIKTRDLYNFRSRSYWLRRMENHDRKEFVPVDEYTIEHILPQNENLSSAWKKELGDEWQRVQEMWVHTLGNLTLTGYNAEYSDRSFAEKRDMHGGFRESPLRLNEYMRVAESWNETEIKGRADRLAAAAVKVWQSPAIPGDMLAVYRG